LAFVVRSRASYSTIGGLFAVFVKGRALQRRCFSLEARSVCSSDKEMEGCSSVASLFAGIHSFGGTIRARNVRSFCSTSRSRSRPTPRSASERLNGS